MIKPDLSIIIPCYNCQKTLEEAVASCFIQGLTDSKPFEIVMVDDGSHDGTRDLMQSLAKKYSNIRLYFHGKNMGGGVARNTAVANAEADIIFCLDSDDMLAPGTLKKMLDFMREKKCDGVGVHYSQRFLGADVNNKGKLYTFGFAGEKIPFKSLLFQKDGMYCPLYSVFMHTKKSFEIAGGYSTEHGFDTQSFAWRFLANGLTAYTCPDTTYMHRIEFHKSYYLREYEAGKANYNWFCVFREFLYLFTKEIQEMIINFDYNDERNIFELITDLGEKVFIQNYQTLLQKNTQHIQMARLVNASSRTTYDNYWLGWYFYSQKEWGESITYLTESVSPDKTSKKLYYLLFDAIAHKGNTDYAALAPEMTKDFSFRRRGQAVPLLPRIIRKMKKEIKKNGFLYKPILMLYSLKGNISGIFHCNEYKAYHEKIDRIIRKKKIVLDIEFGGLGDWLVFTSLPRLLKEKYDIDFYLSEKSIAKVRNNIIFKMCFEMNPFYKGTDRNDDIFAYRPFTQEKNFLNFLFDIRGISVTENIEKQFGLEDCAKGMPEIYYKPKKMSAYENTILIDRHYISGKKLGWLYHDSSFEREAMKQMGLSHGLRIEYSDPLKQDLFTYADMVYSCRHFITPLSGGAALAACFDKPFTVILPYNVYGQSVNQFVFKRSRAQYIIKDLYNLKK